MAREDGLERDRSAYFAMYQLPAGMGGRVGRSKDHDHQLRKSRSLRSIAHPLKHVCAESVVLACSREAWKPGIGQSEAQTSR